MARRRLTEPVLHILAQELGGVVDPRADASHSAEHAWRMPLGESERPRRHPVLDELALDDDRDVSFPTKLGSGHADDLEVDLFFRAGADPTTYSFGDPLRDGLIDLALLLDIGSDVGVLAELGRRHQDCASLGRPRFSTPRAARGEAQNDGGDHEPHGFMVRQLSERPMPAPRSAPKVPHRLRPSRLWVLAIGILEYDDGVHWALETRRDTVLLDALRRRGTPDAQIVFLADGKATLRRVRAALLKLLRASQPGDQLPVYYAGHGGRDPDHGGLRLRLRDERLPVSEIFA